MVDNRVQQEFAHGNGENPHGRTNGEFLQEHDRHEQDHQQTQGVGQDTRQGRHEQFGERGNNGRLFLPFCLAILLIIAFMHLDGVADRPGGDKERNDEGEGVEAEADHLDKSQPPNGRYDTGQSGSQRPSDIVKIPVQQQPQQHRRCQKNDVDLLGVEIHPAVQRGLTGQINPRVVVLIRFNHRAPDFLKQSSIIEPLLDKGGIQQGGFFVQRNQHAV